MEHKMDAAKDKRCHDSVLPCMELERGAKHHVTYLAVSTVSTLHTYTLLTRCHDFFVNFFQIPET